MLNRLRKALGAVFLLVLVADCLAGGNREVRAYPLDPGKSAIGSAIEVDGPAQAEASASLRQRLAGLESLTAAFEQQVSDTEGFEMQSMSGEMTVARPGYIHWRTEPPYEQLLVSDTNTLWLYDKDLEQVTVRPFYRDIVNSPAMLFIGDVADMDELYLVSQQVLDGNLMQYTLVPRDDSSVYRELTLTFDNALPVAMALWDSLGQVTRIRFANVRLNQPVDESLFSFQVPPGVDVLHND